MTPVEIYTGDTYYGTIRMAIATAPFTTREEDIKAEIDNASQGSKDRNTQ